jgi:catechol 2,3-dioxygenase-like lactoylglutathione lyase family enzyme
MLPTIQRLDYVILLCDDFARMKEFYQPLFGFAVVAERADVLAMNAGSVTFCLRKRTRHYDGTSPGLNSPGVQLAFCVKRGEVDQCHAELMQRGITILDPPTDQFWGHRTVFFRDPEGNILEFYEEIKA